MVDYTSLADSARSVIEGVTGRSITLVKLDQTPSDSSKPWRGDADSRANPVAESIQTGIFVQISSAQQLGLRNINEELVKRSDQVVLFAPGSTETLDFTEFDEIHDSDNTIWKITFMEVLKPGEIPLLYYAGVKK